MVLDHRLQQSSWLSETYVCRITCRKGSACRVEDGAQVRVERCQSGEYAETLPHTLLGKVWICRGAKPESANYFSRSGTRLGARAGSISATLQSGT